MHLYGNHGERWVREKSESILYETHMQMLVILYMDMYMQNETISLTRGVCSCHSSQPRTWHPSPWPSLSAHHGKGSWNHSTQIQHQTRGREGRRWVKEDKEKGEQKKGMKRERGHVGCNAWLWLISTFRHTAKFSGHNIVMAGWILPWSHQRAHFHLSLILKLHREKFVHRVSKLCMSLS